MKIADIDIFFKVQVVCLMLTAHALFDTSTVHHGSGGECYASSRVFNATMPSVSGSVEQAVEIPPLEGSTNAAWVF